MGFLFEEFVASSTLERLSARVNPQVVNEVAFFRKRFFALVANKDRVESVSFLVDLFSYVIVAPLFFLQDRFGLDYSDLLKHILVLSSEFYDSFCF